MALPISGKIFLTILCLSSLRKALFCFGQLSFIPDLVRRGNGGESFQIFSQIDLNSCRFIGVMEMSG